MARVRTAATFAAQVGLVALTGIVGAVTAARVGSSWVWPAVQLALLAPFAAYQARARRT
jgi:hypothetical protein